MAKDSRFAQIYREELKKNKGIFGSLASTGGARAKEMLDLRQYLLPQMGVSGAIAQRVFGKSFKYGGGAGVRNVGGAGTSSISDKVVSEKLTRIDANGKIAAKNSIVLPAMARDMNLMRMNMQKMVKLSGGTPANKADMFFKRASEREGIYESQFKKSSDSGLTPTTPSSESGGIMSSILGFLKMPILDMFSGLVGALIKGGLITAAIAGLGNLIGNLITDGEFRKTVFDTVDRLMQSVFGEDVWKNLAIGTTALVGTMAALNASFSSLSKGLGALPLQAGLVGLAGFVGYKIGDVLNTAITNAYWGDKSVDYRKQDVDKMGEDVAPVLTNPRFAKMGSNLAKSRLEAGTDEAEISNIERDISQRISKGKLSKSDERYIEKQKSKIHNLQERIEKNKKLQISPTPVSSENSTSPGKTETSPTKLEGFNYDAYAAAVGQRESSGNYQAINSLGYVGKYQMGSAALQDEGLIKNGTKQSKEEMSNPNNWTIPGGLQSFLNDPQLQENVMANYTKRNMNALKNLKVINDKSSSEEIAGALATSHLLGPGGAQQLINTGKDDKDAYGTKGSEYLALGKASQTGGISPAPTLTASVSSKSVTTPQTEESSFSDTIVTAIAGLLQVSQDTNKQIQAVAAASSKGSESSSAMIESPYDREAFDSLFRYHADIHSSSA